MTLSSTMAYQLHNPVEPLTAEKAVFNFTHETSHPVEPAVYVQLQAEALYGVRLGARRLSEILVQFYGYRWIKGALPVLLEKVDMRQAREDADTDDLFHNESLVRDGLIRAIRQSIPCDVVTLSERLDEEAA
ncbi:hypothetical protein DZ860_16660 [Vibrio sinensis]|uniref:Uncharacterized protein n=1 Tax=Vibrio sinensis TaxID=2302434 RepID=A0A3A6Q9R4_9VIBR|nr:hypothetical protein [Vibrio sinensis]RJX68627.1 hypothetical protein DZ860_16660 [Vibrio sinensis]